jgi:putative drug exporter of the RND superfamily
VFARIGDLVIRRARRILVVAGVAVLVFAALGVHASGKLLSAGFTSPSAPSQQAEDRLTADFGGGNNLIFLVEARSGNVDTPAVASAGSALAARLAGEAGVSDVSSYWSTHAAALRSRDGRAALVVGNIAGSDKTVGTRAKALVAQLSVAPRAPGPVTILAGGSAGVSNAVNKQIASDLKVAEGLAIPITALLLIVVFGSLVAALLPVAIGVVSIFATLFVLWVLGSITDVSIYAVNLTTALGLGLGIDYALLMVNRYREELAGGIDIADAVRASVNTAGRTILFSAATVAAALASLIVFPVYFLRSFAYAGISVVAVSTVAALVVLPALLATLGPRVNALAVPWGRGRPTRVESPFWRATARRVMAHPFASGLPIILLLAVLAIPFAHVHFGSPDDRVLPTSSAARQVGDALRTQFPADTSNTIDVVTSRQVAGAPAATYSRDLSNLAGVADVRGPAGTWVRGAKVSAGAGEFQAPDASWFSAVITPDPLSNAAATLVHEVRALPPPGGATAYAGGQAALLVDQKHDLGSRLPLALALIVVTTLVVLFLFTGSVLLPIKALVLNALTLSAVFGIVVWIFQYGHLSGLLNFTPTATSTTMPLLLFCIAFGLSMDYEVFLLSRIKELHDAGASNAESVAGGLARTGRIVTTAAALLAVTFFAFGLSKVSFIQLFGIGTALAILIDATLIRGVLVPAFMAVAGPANWWAPKPLRRLHQRIGLAEAPPQPPARPLTAVGSD